MKQLLLPALGIIAPLLLVAWLVAELVCERSFVGTLASKHDEVNYYHDERETDIETDAEGRVSVTTSGTDETVATRRYLLTFSVDGRTRMITAGAQSARVPYVRADHMALQRLNASAVEPALYTHCTLQRQYLVKVRGWLLDGRLVEITDLATIAAE